MGYPSHKKLKTEHNGAKHGKGSFYGRKQEAKQFSAQRRRQTDRLLAHGNFESFEEESEHGF